MLSLNYTTNGQMATFTFDSSQQSQMDVFGQVVENHNTLTHSGKDVSLQLAIGTRLLRYIHDGGYVWSGARIQYQA